MFLHRPKQFYSFVLVTVLFVLSYYGCTKYSSYTDSSFDRDFESEYIAFFGDIQYYTISDASLVNYQFSINWIDNQLDSISIKCLIHTGDITQSNTLDQWERFSSSISGLSSKIPCYSMIGDHDYSWNGTIIEDRSNTLFSQYLDFPSSAKNVESFFEDGHWENVVIQNIIDGERYDLIFLEFGPRDEVIDWANKIIKSHPDRHYILLTHEYLEKDGGRRRLKLKSLARLRGTTINTPNQIWDKLIKCNNNILCVICGHVGSLYSLTLENNDFGREVPQIQHNIQAQEYRHDNWLMLWRFHTSTDSCSISILNTRTGAYYLDSPVLFKFRYRY